jgi:fatty-acyl-CoA synthase
VRQARKELFKTQHFIVIEGEKDDLATHEYEELLASASTEYFPPAFEEDDIAELFYTSGTTGKPKGVALTHRNLHLHTLYGAIALRACDEDVVLHMIPLFHVNGLGQPHIFTLVGAKHVMLRKYDPAVLLRLVQEHRVTHLIGVPFFFSGLVNHPEVDKYDLSSLKFVMAGGAAAAPSLIRAMQEKLIKTAMAGYGLTETSPLVCLAYPRQHLTKGEPPEMQFRRQSMTGWPIPGSEIRVVDRYGNDVRPDGTHIGEIIIRSNVVMKSYYKDKEATERALRDGWLHTGDMSTLDDEGYMTIVDRSKDVIISGGENISSIEIENALHRHPAVSECAVVAAPDKKWGETPVALIVLKPGVTATSEEVHDHCRKELAAFKVPKRYEFRDNLPKSGTGKILKSELREEFWRGHEKRVN